MLRIGLQSQSFCMPEYSNSIQLPPKRTKKTRFTAILACGCALTSAVEAQTTDYTALSLEELSLVPITTLGRKQTTVEDTPAAAFVVTGDDIHRTGALDFAEALRLVPGMEVARINSLDYAISIRGFNDSTSNKLLVLMDERPLYSTAFTGTNWNYYELDLEDVARIEVLRGPGASLWGANAMNGVINVVTKSAGDTLGAMATVASGDQLGLSSTVRDGWRVSDNSAARVYAKFQEEGSFGATTESASGGWDSRLVGTRYDWDGTGGEVLTLIGEYRYLRDYSDTLLPSVLPPDYLIQEDEVKRTEGGNLSAHYSSPIFGSGQISLLTSYEHVSSSQIVYGEDRDTYNADLQFTLHAGLRNEVITGATYREDHDALTSSQWLSYSVRETSTVFTGAFVQDEFTAVPNALSITAGTKIERNSFSGWEVQPSLRSIWRPNATQRVWVGISRAARTPSLSERYVDYFAAVLPPGPTSPLPVALRAFGSNNFESEHVDAYELGYRYQPTLRLSFDLSLYDNQYTDLRGLVGQPPQVAYLPAPHIEEDYTVSNDLHGSTKGGEGSVRWQPSSKWTLEGSASLIRYDLNEASPGPVPDPTIGGLIGSTPRGEYKLRVEWDPTPHWSADAIARYTDALTGPGIAPYTGLDLRLAWKPRADVELEIVGRDLLQPQHAESSSAFLGSDVREIYRSGFIRVTYRH